MKSFLQKNVLIAGLLIGVAMPFATQTIAQDLSTNLKQTVGVAKLIGNVENKLAELTSIDTLSALVAIELIVITILNDDHIDRKEKMKTIGVGLLVILAANIIGSRVITAV